MSTHRDVERLAAVVMDSLDDEGSSDALARRAYASRTQFFRIFRAVIDETPAAMRRRLLLERAAWQLVTNAAVRHPDRPRCRLRIARGVHASVSQGLPHLAQPLPADGCHALPPSGARGDSLLCSNVPLGRRRHGSVQHLRGSRIVSHTEAARARTGARAPSSSTRR